MTIRSYLHFWCLGLLVLLAPTVAHAQIVEAVGTRAQGMGGAFVAVANDSSATWWNPAGLAAGPFLDVALARAVTDTTGELPARRDRASWVALATPPFGVSYYRLRITDVQPFIATVTPPEGREDRRAGVPVRSLAASQWGVTILRTVLPGVHAGTTLKYVRGTVHTSREDGLRSSSDLLDLGAGLDVGVGTDHAFDVDLGLLGVFGALRLGGVARNLRAPTFGEFRLPRQLRVGGALDAEAVGGPPLTVALDWDVKAYRAGGGERQVVALGAEQWMLARRIAVRGGVRANTVGEKERSGTAGVTVAVRPGLFIDGHLVRGGAADDRGWGVTLRTSF